MDDKKCSGKSCGIRFHHNIDANNSRLAKSAGLAKKIVGVVLFASLSWSASAVDQRFPGVEMQLDGLANSVDMLDSAPVVASPLELGAAVSFEASGQGSATGLDEKAANPELISLNVVAPASIVPLDAASLEVIDTGSSKHVQNPQAVAAVPADTEAPVVPESGEYSSTPGAAPAVDQQVRNYKLMLPATAIVATAEINAQPEEVQGAASEEPVRVPFAVLLALMALISMIPVARRNG